VVWTFANGLSVARMCLLPALLYAASAQLLTLGMIIVVFAGLSDYCDGRVARWSNTVTPLGAWLDRLADMLFLNGSWLLLAWLEVLPLWALFGFLVRDLSAVAWLYAQQRRRPQACAPHLVQSSHYERLAVLLQFAMLFGFFRQGLAPLEPLTVGLVFGVGALSSIYTATSQRVSPHKSVIVSNDEPS